MSYEALKGLLGALCAMEGDGELSCRKLSVRYVGDDIAYEEWIPLRSDDILDDGVSDPGFGSGPVLYCEIEAVQVSLDQWRRDSPLDAERAFAHLRVYAVRIPGLKLRPELISWER